MDKSFKKIFITTLAASVIVSAVFGSLTGFWVGLYASGQVSPIDWFRQEILGQTGGAPAVRRIEVVDEQSAVIKAVEKVSPSVASIIITKDLSKIQRYNGSPFGSDFFQQFFSDNSDGFNFNPPQYRQQGTEKVEVGGGSGFIVSADGYVVTNKHVVADETAEYTALMNDGKKYGAKVMARDSVSDLAVLKIEAKNLPTVELGDSANLKVGQTVIAIGNALGEFRNTVSRGVISGLSRSVTAGGAGFGSENLVGVIQTDASINPGNSGGPLLNIAGQVIGINTAMAQGAQNIGFAIPINEVKNSIESVKATGRIIRPWLGVRYIMINKEIAQANNLPLDYGALIVRGDTRTDLAVVPASPADKAGLQENDIILEINGVKLDENNSLGRIVGQHKIGEEITLKIFHRGEEKAVKVKLEEMK